MNEEFDKFIKEFDIKERNIKRKYDHSKRVQKLCEKLTKHNPELASIIGLLHDYGRFYQWTKYKTFDDKKSIDHADYAVNELFEKGKIINFYQKKEEYKIIYDAIKYHNKYRVPNQVENKYMCELIRDADKLDILYMYTIDDLLLSEEGTISEKIKEEFYKHNLIDFKYVESKIDRSVNVISLIYDLNLIESFKYLKENQIIEKMEEKTIRLNDYFKEVKSFIDKKLREEEMTC